MTDSQEVVPLKDAIEQVKTAVTRIALIHLGLTKGTSFSFSVFLIQSVETKKLNVPYVTYVMVKKFSLI